MKDYNKNRKGAIILIDDNKSELALCTEALKDVQFSNELIMFNDSTDAMEYIMVHSKNIFLIISDVNMPKLSGIEMLKKIHGESSNDKVDSIPFIFLTNSDAPADIMEAYALPMQGYFIKPMLLSDLSYLLKSIINYWSCASIPKDCHSDYPSLYL
jgi:response regulator RpfG family c-di-GMP phosphodiesterase